MKFSVPPGYKRKKPPAKPKLDPFIRVSAGQMHCRRQPTSISRGPNQWANCDAGILTGGLGGVGPQELDGTRRASLCCIRRGRVCSVAGDVITHIALCRTGRFRSVITETLPVSGAASSPPIGCRSARALRQAGPCLEAERIKHAIRLPANQVLQ